MFAVKLLTNSAVELLHSFEHAEHFHISHFPYHLSIMDYSWKLLAMLAKLYYVMLNSNKPIRVAHLQKLANQCWLAHLW